MKKEVFSLCLMCSVRCPIKVEAENGHVSWIEGNQNMADIGDSLCPTGAAGISMLYDDQRPQSPLIRVGKRGAGNWRKASWDEAIDYVATQLAQIIDKDGGQSVALGERTQLSTHVSKTFLNALKSPNHFTHDSLCKGSVNTACRSLFGYTDEQMGINYSNTKHIVLYGRNIFEALAVKEVKALMKALEKGAKITYIDPRVTITASKAHQYWMIRPGTDLALNYALIHVILKELLYDAEFVSKWVYGLNELRDFVEEYTPKWAEVETGIPKEEIIDLAREVSRNKPSIIFHYGYRGTSHTNEIYMRRSILMLNALMGSVEAKGGIYFRKGPGEVGKKPARTLLGQNFPKIDVPRFDKTGTKDFPLPFAPYGVAQILPYAILNEDPYPIKALIAYHFDPLMSISDTNQTKRALDKLDLFVTIDINYSDIAWYSDVILPESTYLERTDCIMQMNDLTPYMFLRKKAVEPRYDTMDGAMILKKIGEKLGIGSYFPYETMEDLVEWQLEGTGFTMKDFEEKGFVTYGSGDIFWDRDNIPFLTPSGKIEFKSSLLENADFESFSSYEAIPKREDGKFRLIVGRTAIHTHISTQNVPYLNGLESENTLWINTIRADELGIKNNAIVEVASSVGKGQIKAFVTDLIHPEAVFMLHGYGHEAVWAKRSFNKGLSDTVLMENVYDKVGGSASFDETFVTVKLF